MTNLFRFPSREKKTIAGKEVGMDQSFDIFLLEGEDGVRLVGTAASLEAAKMIVEELGFRSPGKYLILGKPSGERTIIVRHSRTR
jgi:hypothetical protein